MLYNKSIRHTSVPSGQRFKKTIFMDMNETKDSFVTVDESGIDFKKPNKINNDFLIKTPLNNKNNLDRFINSKMTNTSINKSYKENSIKKNILYMKKTTDINNSKVIFLI